MAVLRLLTLNAHMGFDLTGRRFVLRELREAIRGVGADLVLLQETGLSLHHRARLHPEQPLGPLHEFLADSVWPEFAYGRNAMLEHGHLGNALLSKFPIVRHDNRDVSIDGHEERGLLHAVVDVPGLGAPLHAICVHLGLREHHRRRQLEWLCGIVGDHVPPGAPLVVAGDFNDWRRRGHPLLARCGLHEVFLRAHGRLARTFPVRWPLLPLDRIYLRNLDGRAPRVLAGAPWTRLSDHAPLLVELSAVPVAAGGVPTMPDSPPPGADACPSPSPRSRSRRTSR